MTRPPARDRPTVALRNSEIAAIFDRVADLLEIEGAKAIRVRAYRTSARTVEAMPQSLADLVESGADLSQISAIGRDLAREIAEDAAPLLGMELEGLSAEDREFEVAKQIIHFVGAAIEGVASAPAGAVK